MRVCKGRKERGAGNGVGVRMGVENEGKPLKSSLRILARQRAKQQENLKQSDRYNKL